MGPKNKQNKNLQHLLTKGRQKTNVFLSFLVFQLWNMSNKGSICCNHQHCVGCVNWPSGCMGSNTTKVHRVHVATDRNPQNKGTGYLKRVKTSPKCMAFRWDCFGIMLYAILMHRKVIILCKIYVLCKSCHNNPCAN